MIIPHGRRSLASVAGFVLLTIAIGFAGLHLVVAPLALFFPSWPLQSSRFSQQRLPPPPATYHNYTSAFSFDLNETTSAGANYSSEAWMARVPDATPLTRLSIPGTHDTFTFTLTDNVVFQCQNHDLPAQLRAGLRYFDVRGRLVVPASTSAQDQQQQQQAADSPVIGIFHGHVPTGHTFEDVLLTLFAYLDAHPSEGVVLRVKEEGAPVYQDPPEGADNANNNWRTGGYNTTFEEAFNHYRTNNTRTAPGCARHLLMPWPPLLGGGDGDDRVIPTMGQLRGRILVLYEFPVAASVPAPYGIPWDTPPYTSLEDLWVIPDAAHLDDKWAAVRAHLEEVAAAGSGDDQAAGDDTLFLTHLSASTGVTPIEAAAGPLGDAARRPAPDGSVIRGLNDRTGLWLEAEDEDDRNRHLAQDAFRKTGIVMVDFPGRRLVEDILGRNEWLYEKDSSSSSSS